MKFRKGMNFSSTTTDPAHNNDDTNQSNKRFKAKDSDKNATGIQNNKNASAIKKPSVGLSFDDEEY